MMEGTGLGPLIHHSPDAELFKALFLFGSHITTPGILPPSGIDTMASLRDKSDLVNNEIPQSEPVKALVSQQMGQRSSCVKAPSISVTNSATCQGFENITPNPLVRGPNQNEPQLTENGRSFDIFSSNAAQQAKKKKPSTLVAILREQNEQQFNAKSSTISEVPEGVEHALEVFYKILQNIPKSGRQSVRALKKMQASYSYLFSYPEGKVGTLPEVEVGRKVKWRVELKILGLHRQIEKGIDCKEVSGNRKDGHKELIALSVVCSNAYEDDIDKGETLFFTGEGGRNKKTKRQIEDQVLGGGNEALYNSYYRRNAIRVIRHRYDAQSMKWWYIYDGLYKVEDKKKVLGISGKEVWQFKLIREPNQKPLECFPRVAKTKKGQGKQAKVTREVLEMRGKGVHGKQEGSGGHVEGEQPRRNEEESEEETSVSESDEDNNFTDSEEEVGVDSSDFDGEAQDSLSSSKKKMEEEFVLGKTKRSRDLSERKRVLRAGEDAIPTGSEEKYKAMVDQFKHHDMGGKVVYKGGLCQFSNLAKKKRSSGCGKQHRNGDAHPKERSDGVAEILLVPKQTESTFCSKKANGNHDVLQQQANLLMQMVSEDEDRDIEYGSDSDNEESDDKEFEVEAIINHRTRIIDGCKQLEYRVCWKEYGEEDNSWEPAKNMGNAPIIVRNYWKQIGFERANSWEGL